MTPSSPLATNVATVYEVSKKNNKNRICRHQDQYGLNMVLKVSDVQDDGLDITNNEETDEISVTYKKLEKITGKMGERLGVSFEVNENLVDETINAQIMKCKIEFYAKASNKTSVNEKLEFYNGEKWATFDDKLAEEYKIFKMNTEIKFKKTGKYKIAIALPKIIREHSYCIKGLKLMKIEHEPKNNLWNINNIFVEKEKIVNIDGDSRHYYCSTPLLLLFYIYCTDVTRYDAKIDLNDLVTDVMERVKFGDISIITQKMESKKITTVNLANATNTNINNKHVIKVVISGHEMNNLNLLQTILLSESGPINKVEVNETINEYNISKWNNNKYNVNIIYINNQYQIYYRNQHLHITSMAN